MKRYQLVRSQLGDCSANRGSESASGAKVAAARAQEGKISRAGAQPELPVFWQVGIASEPAQSLAYTREETAALLGITACTIDRLTELGQLRPSRATQRPLYALEELRRFLRETTVKLEIREDGRAEL